jgi:hypothetical protein
LPISLAQELRLTRPAVLYGDSVTLVSTPYEVSEVFSQIFGALDTHPERFVDFLESTNPLVHRHPFFSELIALRRTYLTSPSLNERRAAFESLRRDVAEIAEVAEQQGSPFERIIDVEAFSELKQALASGILHVDRVTNFADGGLSSMMRQVTTGVFEAIWGNGQFGEIDALPDSVAAFARRLVRLLGDETSYPILDSQSREFIGEFTPDFGSDHYARERSKIGGVAYHILGQLPTTDVPLAELFELRVKLSDHLNAFRCLVAELADRVRFAQWDDDFQRDVAHHYNNFIDPQVRDLDTKLGELIPKEAQLRKKSLLRLGITSAAPILQGWVARTLLDAQGLDASLRRLVEQLVEDTASKVRRELDDLAKNKLYYYSALEHELVNRRE